jgi:hypothetical protein
MKSSLIGFTVIVMLAGGLFGTSTPSATGEATVGVGPSDVEILEALAYGSGDLARQLGVEIGADIPASSGFDLLDYRLKAEEASAELLAAERQRLRPVLEDLRSGDLYRVRDASETLGEIVVDHTRQKMVSQNIDVTDESPVSGGGRCGFAVVCIAYAAAGVHNVVVATAGAAVVVGAALWCGAWAWCSREASSGESTAARERLAVQVASNIR